MARRRVGFALCSTVLAATLTLVLAVPAQAAARWSPPRNVFPVDVSEISPDGTHRERPALEVRSDAAGDALAAWIQKVGSSCQARWASRPVGGDWSAPHHLAMANCPFSSAGSQIALAMNKAGTAVVGYDDGINVVAALHPSGGTFGTPKTMNSTGFATDPAVSINQQGTVAVGWILHTSGFSDPSPFQARIRPA